MLKRVLLVGSALFAWTSMGQDSQGRVNLVVLNSPSYSVAVPATLKNSICVTQLGVDGTPDFENYASKPHLYIFPVATASECQSQRAVFDVSDYFDLVTVRSDNLDMIAKNLKTPQELLTQFLPVITELQNGPVYKGNQYDVQRKVYSLIIQDRHLYGWIEKTQLCVKENPYADFFVEQGKTEIPMFCDNLGVSPVSKLDAFSSKPLQSI